VRVIGVVSELQAAESERMGVVLEMIFVADLL
jgi:hypothetical protein